MFLEVATNCRHLQFSPVHADVDYRHLSIWIDWEGTMPPMLK